jgi:hypothetical protein
MRPPLLQEYAAPVMWSGWRHVKAQDCFLPIRERIDLMPEETKYRQINSVGCKLWAKEVSMKPIRVPDLSPEQLTDLEELYRSTRNVRLRTRAQMVLLAAERGLTAREISERSSAPARRRCVAG